MFKRSLETLASAIKMWVNDKFTHSHEEISDQIQDSHKEISNQIKEVVENLSIEVPVTSVNGMTGDVIINQTPANWDQNDETASDYVKGRTHYSETVTEQLVNEVTLEVSEPGSAVLFPEPFEIVAGSVYDITCNGEHYQCTAALFQEIIPAVGNLAFVGMESDTDAPFIIMYGHGEGTIFMAIEAGTFVVSVSGTVEKVKPLDSKFIPALKAKDLQNFMRIDWDARDRGEFILEQPVIVNRPFSRYHVATVEWDGDTTGKEVIDVVDLGDGKYTSLCKITDDVSFARYSFNGAEITEYFSDGSWSPSTEVVKSLNSYISICGENPRAWMCMDIDSISVIVIRDGEFTPWEGVLLTPGVYVKFGRDANTGLGGNAFEVKLYYYEGFLHPWHLPISAEIRDPYFSSFNMVSSSGKLYKITIDNEGKLISTPIDI